MQHGRAAFVKCGIGIDKTWELQCFQYKDGIGKWICRIPNSTRVVRYCRRLKHRASALRKKSTPSSIFSSYPKGLNAALHRTQALLYELDVTFIAVCALSPLTYVGCVNKLFESASGSTVRTPKRVVRCAALAIIQMQAVSAADSPQNLLHIVSTRGLGFVVSGGFPAPTLSDNISHWIFEARPRKDASWVETYQPAYRNIDIAIDLAR